MDTIKFLLHCKTSQFISIEYYLYIFHWNPKKTQLLSKDETNHNIFFSQFSRVIG